MGKYLGWEMRQRWMWTGVLLAILITAGISISRPYLPSAIPLGSQWSLLQWLGRAYPVAVTAVLAGIVLGISERRQMVLLASAMINVVLLYLVLIGYFSFTLYQLWQDSQMGRYFLPPQSNYFFLVVWRFAWAYVQAGLTALGMVGFFLFLRRFRQGRLLGEIEIVSGAFVALVLGFERSLVALLLALGIAIGLSIVRRLKGPSGFVRLANPLLISAWMAMFWGSDLAHFWFGS